LHCDKHGHMISPSRIDTSLCTDRTHLYHQQMVSFKTLNKLVRIRYDSETEPSGHFLMSDLLLRKFSTDMNSSRQVSKIGHVVWTATFYPIFLEEYVKCVFRTNNKAGDEV
jgi:hypothetical protein